MSEDFRLRGTLEEDGVVVAMEEGEGEAAVVGVAVDWELSRLEDKAAWSDDCLVDERVTLRGGMNKCASLWYFILLWA